MVQQRYNYNLLIQALWLISEAVP